MLVQEKKIKGFNIIELLVVLAIIGIIGGLGVPGIMKWVKTRAVANTAEKITSEHSATKRFICIYATLHEN
jgi:prepilin-type N-terminal cleavage/methylation domain-containing protein